MEEVGITCLHVPCDIYFVLYVPCAMVVGLACCLDDFCMDQTANGKVYVVVSVVGIHSVSVRVQYRYRWLQRRQ